MTKLFTEVFQKADDRLEEGIKAAEAEAE